MYCSICQKDIASRARDIKWLKGNNAQPVNNGRCCDVCDKTIVIPARLVMIKREKFWSVSEGQDG